MSIKSLVVMWIERNPANSGIHYGSLFEDRYTSRRCCFDESLASTLPRR